MAAAISAAEMEIAIRLVIAQPQKGLTQKSGNAPIWGDIKIDHHEKPGKTKDFRGGLFHILRLHFIKKGLLSQPRQPLHHPGGRCWGKFNFKSEIFLRGAA
ncbi:hypothetical protein P9213_13910, partial [Geobacillus stearothermophilus]|uniref:hypothetical protein n=1 Tax=Geobacillus stearothermophilus TaxID=1422 RepID=UPI002E2378E1|nr:hypothetical protein [Geobacillus stearothermophilus]